MIRMIRTLLETALPAALVALVFLGAGCGEDPELQRKSQQQKAEIQRLESELRIVLEQIKNAPKDRGAELAEVAEKLRHEEARIAGIEKAIDDLAKERKKLEEEFDSYKRSYPLR